MATLIIGSDVQIKSIYDILIQHMNGPLNRNLIGIALSLGIPETDVDRIRSQCVFTSMISQADACHQIITSWVFCKADEARLGSLIYTLEALDLLFVAESLRESFYPSTSSTRRLTRQPSWAKDTESATNNIIHRYPSISKGDPTSQDEHGYTLLHRASRQLTPVQYHELTEYLVKTGLTKCFEILDNNGANILHHAVFNLELLPETLDLLKSLTILRCDIIVSIIDFNAKDVNGLTPLHCAVQSNSRSYKILRKLVNCGADIGVTDNQCNGLLHYCAAYGYAYAIPLLISLGISVDKVNYSGQSPVHCAFYSDTDLAIKVLRQLVLYNFDLNLQDNNGRTALHTAVEIGMDPLTAIKFLVSNGAKVNLQDNSGATMLTVPLSKRTPTEYHDILMYIEEVSSSCLSKPDNKCRTPLHVSVQYLDIEEKTLQLLVKHNDINSVTTAGNSPIFFAIWGGRDREFIDMMIGHFKSDPEVQNDENRNGFHWAAKYGNISALELFAKCATNVNVNEKDKSGLTPLHFAFDCDNEKVKEVVEILVNAGGDVNAKDSKGESPFWIYMGLEFARLNGNLRGNFLGGFKGYF